METQQHIALLGLGAMGSRIAANFLAAGYRVTVWNRSPQAVAPLVAQGAVAASTPKEAATHAGVVLSMLTDNDASRSIWLTPETGAAFGLQQGAVAIESSTLTVEWTQALSQVITDKGAKFLAAPVVGSRPQAEAQKLVCLVGGEASIFAQVKPLLLATASFAYHVGTPAQAMAMKLAVNALFGIQVVALAEVLGHLQQQGISPATAMACLNEMPVTSPAAKGAGALITAGKHQPLFPITLVAKDLCYALENEKRAISRQPVTTATHQVFKDAIARGLGQQNITGIAQHFIH